MAVSMTSTLDDKIESLLHDVTVPFSSVTKKDLQRYLRGKNLPLTGTKLQLVERIRGAFNLGLCDEQSSNVSDNIRGQERLVTPLGETLPDPLSIMNGWIDNFQTFPHNFTDSELINFLIYDRHCHDHAGRHAKKGLGKAQMFYDNGHVQDVRYHQIDQESSHCFILCQCLPSFPGTSVAKKPNYNVWVCLSKETCRVHSAYCDCPAGKGESCNHIAALLVALVDISKKQRDGKFAATSRACSWIKPRKRNLSPKRSTAIEFQGKPKHQNHDFHYHLENTGCSNTLSETEFVSKYDSFRSRLKNSCSNAAWLKNFCQDDLATNSVEISKDLLPQLHNVDRLFRDEIDLTLLKDFFENYVDNLSVADEECKKIFDITMGQSDNDHWFSARFGRLTASNFGKVYRRRASTPPDNLLKYLLQYVVPYQGTSVHHGLQYEQRAKESYHLVSRTEGHPSLIIQNSGFVVNPKYPFLGASPDGLVHCDHCVDKEGLLEIKCPWNFRSIHPCEAALNNNFCCNLTKSGKLKLKRTHGYYYQVQGQMAVCNRKWCDFVIWTFKGISVERITFDAELWQSMLSKLKCFYVSAVIPEMFTERVKRGKTLAAIV